MWPEMKQEIATFFYGFTRKYANRLRKARLRAKEADERKNIYKCKVALYVLEVAKLTDMLEKQRRSSCVSGIDVADSHRRERMKAARWNAVEALGSTASVAGWHADGVRDAAKTPQEKHHARAMRGHATRALNKWKKAKEEFDKQYPSD